MFKNAFVHILFVERWDKQNIFWEINSICCYCHSSFQNKSKVCDCKTNAKNRLKFKILKLFEEMKNQFDFWVANIYVNIFGQNIGVKLGSMRNKNYDGLEIL